MKDYETLIADIRREERELNDKLTNLEFFMMTEDFTKISPEQKHLLERQHDLMAQYKTVLIQRAHRINYEHAQEKECTCEPEPEKAESKHFDNDRLCQDCYYFKDMPNGPRCKICDNGSCWEKRERH